MPSPAASMPLQASSRARPPPGSLNQPEMRYHEAVRTLYDDLCRRLGVGHPDRTAAAMPAAAGAPHVDRLAEAMLQHWVAGTGGGPPQAIGSGVEEIRRLLAVWVEGMLRGRRDDEHVEVLRRIGHVSAWLELSPAGMMVAVARLAENLDELAADSGRGGFSPDPASARRLLMAEFGFLMQAFVERTASRIRDQERSAAAERLTRSEHLAQIGQLAASLAHEIKNPLAGISGAIQVIRDELPPDDRRQPVIREILAQINRVDATVKDLLVYARPRPPVLRPCDLRTVVHRVLQSIREAEVMRSVPVEVRCDEQTPPVPADARQLDQLVMNLLFNAAGACREGGSITVSIAPCERGVRLEIADTGHGMDSEVAARAFEPFFTTKARGTGLGLSICSKIVEAHGGMITLHSRPGAGTQVTVVLPQAGG